MNMAGRKIFFHYYFKSGNAIYNTFLIKIVCSNRYQIKTLYRILSGNERINRKRQLNVKIIF